jgi:hypothetical protein
LHKFYERPNHHRRKSMIDVVGSAAKCHFPFASLIG